MDNGTCISLESCPCSFHGLAYSVGSKIEQECTECVCVGGVWNCTEHDCPVQCSVVGDSHFTTFDGRHYSFIGLCQYILVKGTGKDRFTITLQKAHCEQNLGLVCLQSITLILEDDFNKQVTLSRGGQILTSVVEIQTLSSLFILLRTTFGLKILFAIDGERIYIQLSSAWKRRTLGLCGTFNGNIRDDFLSPSGMIEGTPQLHAHAWRVSSTCFAPVHVPMVDPCNINQQNIQGCTTSCVDMTRASAEAPACAMLLPIMPTCVVSAVCPLTLDLRSRSVPWCVKRACCTTTVPHSASVPAPLSPPLSSAKKIVLKVVTVLKANSMKTHLTFVCPYITAAVIIGGAFISQGNSSQHPQAYAGGINCETTCANLAMNFTCAPSSPCISGCVCAAGMAEHKGKCYVPESCPCIWKDWEYGSGEVITTPCYTCVCRRGMFNCTYYPCPAVCTVYGDRHYHSFDGLEYDYISDCQVFLIKNKLAGLCGNFDKCTSNDMTTSNNIEVRNAQVFGDSWALGQIDVTSFAKNCHEDTCNCNLGGDCECLCTNVAAYAYKCCQEGVPVHWRSPTVCALALVSLESAERPNYFLYVHDNDSLSLLLWHASSAFRQRATFFHHQGLWIPGYSAFELYSKKGYFIVFMDSTVKASKYDDSEEFKQSSSFSIEGVLPESSKEELKFLRCEGNWTFYNWSLNCPTDLEMPDCGFRGWPVQVNTDICCPEWECPCRCSMLSELSIITFDGNNAALSSMASYILVRIPGEIVIVHIDKCSMNQGFAMTIQMMTSGCRMARSLPTWKT
ncbi:rCG48779 [Rattus norvegicus]|uniref:RCG48779 n=1 Tax=Rattus norvegicus TaxID=10116 RepID=A6IGD2_RAT|nr:rCG48779 [Rattus norvegicus]